MYVHNAERLSRYYSSFRNTLRCALGLSHDRGLASRIGLRQKLRAHGRGASRSGPWAVRESSVNSIMSGAPQYHLIPILRLAGVILDALGGLYLAYDLLGGKRDHFES